MKERFLTLKDLRTGMFDEFERTQEVDLVWRTIQGEQKLVSEPFRDDWSLEDRQVLVACLRDCLAEGGAVCCIFEGEKIAAFFAMTRPPFGSRGQYADLQSLHVGRSWRRRGLGRRLLGIAAWQAAVWGREKLYISAHSAMESQAFYRAAGCREAEEINPAHAEAEPFDIQMEYPIPAFAAVPMTERYAAEIAGWRYPAPYDVYHLRPEDQAELLGGSYSALLGPQGILLGFFCFGAPARIAAEEAEAYASGALDIGLGLAPLFCGRKFGPDFLRLVSETGRAQFGAGRFRLTVAAFNCRAQRAYEKAEFRFCREITQKDTGRVFRILEAGRI